jgi:hypothetical protein
VTLPPLVFPATARVRVNQRTHFPLMPTYFLFPPPDPTPTPQPAGTTLTSHWGRKHHIRWKAESTLALAESGYVVLPGPIKI